MEDEEAAGVVSLLDEVLSLINLAEVELIKEYFPDGFFEEGEGGVGHE